MKRRSFLILVGFMNASVFQALAEDLGVYGQTFVIAEPDLLEEIQERLNRMQKDGSLLTHQRRCAAKAQARIQRPQSVAGISKAQVSHAFLYDPSLTVPVDLKDHQGRVFHKQGTRINPLDQMRLNQALLFIDGDDAAQQVWAQEQLKQAEGAYKIILVKGAPLALMEEWQLPVYFDQGGSLCRKLGIRHVPARVVQQGKHLQIREIALEEATPTLQKEAIK